jgi:hypothetical protein
VEVSGGGIARPRVEVPDSRDGTREGGGGGRGRRKEKYGGADVIPRCFQGGGRGQAACVLH